MRRTARLLYLLAALGLVAATVLAVMAVVQDWVSPYVVFPAELPRAYQVQPGDTPTSVAERFSLSVEDLRGANPRTLTPEFGDVDFFPEGVQTLNLPSRQRTHTVRRGDTLQSIAETAQVSVVRLIALNRETLSQDTSSAADPQTTSYALRVGTILILPYSDVIKDNIPLWASLYSVLIVGTLVLFVAAWQKGSGKDVLDIFRGDTGRYSISQLQMFLWTGVFVFAYMIVIVARLLNGQHELTTDVPGALLALMGISIGTFSGARVIEGQQQPTAGEASPTGAPGGGGARQVEVPSGPEHSRGLADLIQDPSGKADVARVQLLFWTMIGAGLYLFQTVANLQVTNGLGLAIPDVDGTILALTIASSGGYLAKEFIWRKPKSPVARIEVANEETLFLYGFNFGDPTDNPDQYRIEMRRDAPGEAEWAEFRPEEDGGWTETLLRGKAVRILPDAAGQPVATPLRFPAGQRHFVRVRVTLAGTDYPEASRELFPR